MSPHLMQFQDESVSEIRRRLLAREVKAVYRPRRMWGI